MPPHAPPVVERSVFTSPRVFVSSTSKRNAERLALKNELGGVYRLYLYEHDRASGAPPKKRCSDAIERSDAFVSILGPEYGSLFPDPPPRSIVEWEFDVAIEKQHAEILPFVKNIEPPEEWDPRQEAFVSRVTDFGNGFTRRTYWTPAQLASEARTSLAQWLVELRDRIVEERRRRRPWFFGVAAMATALPLVLIASGWWNDRLTRDLVVDLTSLCGIAALAGLSGVWWLSERYHD